MIVALLPLTAHALRCYRSCMQSQGSASLLTLDEVEQRLAVSRRSIMYLISDGKLKSVKLGKRRLVDERDLVQFIDQLRGQ